MDFLFTCPLFFAGAPYRFVPCAEGVALLGGISQAEAGGHCLGRGEFGTVIQMSIDIGCGGEIAVSQPLLNLLHGNAIGEKQAGARVAEVVEANGAHPVGFEEFGEGFRDVVGAEDVAYLVYTQVTEIFLVVAPPAQLLVGFLLALEFQQAVPNLRDKRPHQKYLEKDLSPYLNRDAVFIMDNIRSHHDKAVKVLLDQVKVHNIYLPPYSPDLNPIEKLWSKVKALLRKFKARSGDKLAGVIQKAFRSVTASDCLGWFRSCGYVL